MNNYPSYFINVESREKFFNIIISCLSTSSKQLLIDNNIRLSQTILSKTPAFNYISLCKFFNGEILTYIMRMVFKEEFLIKVDSKKVYLFLREMYKLFISQCKGIKTFVWDTYEPLLSFPGALTFFSQLYSLKINLWFIDSNSLYRMSQICKDLGELIIENCSQDITGLTSLIDAQRNLKIVSLEFKIMDGSCEELGTCEELSKALARRGCTINNPTLHDSVDVIPHSFLTSLVSLKYLGIYYGCESYERNIEFQKYLAISKFPDLQSLEIKDDLLCFKKLAMLIEKTKGNISNIYIETCNESAENSGMLLNAISNHCPRIENLVTYLGPNDLIYVKLLLMNCKNLVCLNLFGLNENSDIGDELLDILIKFSPKYLLDILISGYWKYSIDVFVNFFESYRGRKFCFNISDVIEYITKEHLNVVKYYFDEGIVTYSNLLNYIKL
ncbi:hypothetical protein RhiirA1_469176 [Rhizophagus irregularis]|uniref:RNI-like protein n=1 Tax=Rhizophagus irregularis TaxID=588596 RepID=A0A2N0R8J6_9GLOM|nr:hypothetical protein RhiirA1_469176 [Rhizophagus irregularis]